ncbi:hypothetical protein [Terriglobus roseus]|uniref:Uncharacterized protein n=1 Tax=Terriglobus roseus TaxID=392734 RepID=A0A1H4J8V9_9BACT|nr:hypothetical protein [Terriglobus roseus]SEB42078.1 hypothetical protein SAMN05443244_0413 [Terriglobus roseus]
MDEQSQVVAVPAPKNEADLFPMYPMKGRTPVFPDDVKETHRRTKTPLLQYVLSARPLAFLTAPLIYLCLVAFLMLDVFVSLYQAICFPIYGIPKARRSDYLIFDRGALLYLNALERFNCINCSYANGLIAYVMEIVGRTEQHWCPLKHAQKLITQHSRYRSFLPYGDARMYRERIDGVREEFEDLRP